MIGSAPIPLNQITGLSQVTTSEAAQWISGSTNGATSTTDATWYACGIQIPNAGGTIKIGDLSHNAGIQTLQI